MYRQGVKFILFRFVRILFIISFVIPTSLTTPANIAFAQDSPGFIVRHDMEQVHSGGWTPGETLTLQVDDLIPETPLYTETGTVWDDGNYHFELAGVYDIQPGFIVTVTNGIENLVHTVQDLWITSVDVENNKVYGTAAP